MEELNPLLINAKTKPSFESDVAKWYLLKKGEHYACWRWDSKSDNSNRKYLVTTLDGVRILRDTPVLEDMYTMFDCLEYTWEE